MFFQREPPFLIDFHAAGGGEQLCYVDVGRHGEWGGCPFPEGSEQIDSNARDCRWRMAPNFAWRRKGGETILYLWQGEVQVVRGGGAACLAIARKFLRLLVKELSGWGEWLDWGWAGELERD